MDQKQIFKPQSIDEWDSEKEPKSQVTNYHSGFYAIDLEDRKKYFQEIITDHQELFPFSQGSDKAQIQIESLLKKINQETLIKLSNHQFTVQQQVEEKFIQFDVQMARHMTTFQIVEVYCKWGRFGKKFNILNTDEKSRIHSNIPLEKGAFATIYQINLFHKVSSKFAVKCLPFQKIQDKHKHFYQILKELFLTHIMSALQIGPLIQKINGFDLVIYQKCMEFSMEKCQTLQEVTFTLEMEKDLKKSLLAMHSLNICHIDIKPMNIMFSSHRKKAVFIDFGFSKILKQSIGQKTETQFQGTYQYCSEEMRKLFKRGQQSKQFIHLYMNDLYGLKYGVQNLKKKQLQTQQLKMQKSAYEVKQKITNSQIFNNETLLSTYQCTLTNLEQIYGQLRQQSKFTIDQKIEFINNHQEQLFVHSFKFLIYVFDLYFKENYTGSMKSQSFNKMIVQIYHNKLFTDLDIFLRSLNRQAIQNGFQIYDLTANDPKSLSFQQKYYFYKQVQRCHSLQIKENKIIIPPIKKLSKEQKINILKDREKVQIQFLNKQSIIKYFNWIIQLTTFTQIIKEMTFQIRKEIFMIFSIFRQKIQQILISLKDNDITENQCNFAEFNIYQFKPSNRILQIDYPQVILFYSYALIIALSDIELNRQQKQSQSIQKSQIHKEKQSNQQNPELSQFEISFQQMFLILKNSVLLQFNYYLFLKIYLKKCIQKILKSEQYRKNFMLIVTKQLIQIGSLIHSTYLEIRKNQEQRYFLRSQFLNEQLLIFDMDIEFIVKNEQKQKIKQNLKTIQNMWVFFNQDLMTFNCKYEDLIHFFLQIQNNLKYEFKQLNGNQKAKFYVSYFYTLQIIRDYSVTNGLGVKEPYNRNSTLVFDAQKNYQTLINRVCTQEIQHQRTYQESLISQQLNYFNLTYPVILYSHDRLNNSILLQDILFKIDTIINHPQISIFLFSSMKLQNYLERIKNQRFQELIQFFCSDDISFLHNLQFYKKIIQLCIRFVQTGPTNEQAFKYLRILWNSGIKIINLLKLQVGRESNLKFRGQRYISLLYASIVQNLIYIFVILFKKIINNEKMNVKIQILLQRKLMIEEIKQTINNFEEKVEGNLNIEIFNLSVKIKTIIMEKHIKKLRIQGYTLLNSNKNSSDNQESNINQEQIQMIIRLCKTYLKLKSNQSQLARDKKHNDDFWLLINQKIVTEIITYSYDYISVDKYWNFKGLRNKLAQINSIFQMTILKQICQQSQRFVKFNKRRQFLNEILNFFLIFENFHIHQYALSSVKTHFTRIIEMFRTFMVEVSQKQATEAFQALQYVFQNFNVYPKSYIYFLLRQETRQYLQYQLLQERKILQRMLKIRTLRNDQQLMEQLYLINYERKIGHEKVVKKSMSSLRKLMKKVRISSFFRRSIIMKKIDQFLQTLLTQQIPKYSKQKLVNQISKQKKQKYMFVILNSNPFSDYIPKVKLQLGIGKKVQRIMMTMKDDNYEDIESEKTKNLQMMKMMNKQDNKAEEMSQRDQIRSIQSEHSKPIQEPKPISQIERDKYKNANSNVKNLLTQPLQQLVDFLISQKNNEIGQKQLQTQLYEQMFQNYMKSSYQLY